MTLAEQMAADAAGGQPSQPTTSLSAQMAADAAAGPSKAGNQFGGPTGSTYENFMAGAGKAVVDTGRGLKQLIDIPAQWLENRFPGISAWSQSHGMPSAAASAAATNAAVNESQRLDQPLMNTGAGVAGNLAGSAATTMLPLGVVSRAAPATTIGRTAATALNPTSYRAAIATGAGLGAIQPVAEDESRGANALVGAAGGAAGNALINTVGHIAQPVSKIMSDAHAKAVDVLQNAGINLDAAQLSGSTFLNKLRSSFSDNPFTAGAQSELKEEQKAGFNRAALATIGSNADAATPDVMGAAQDRINGVFRDVLNRNNVTLSDPVFNRIAQTQANAADDEKMPVVNMANRIINSIGDDGTIPGQTAYNIKKDVDRLANSPDTTLAFHARQLRSSLMDGITESLPEDDANAFATARSQFRRMKSIEPAIDDKGNGDISPSALARVMARKSNIQASVYGKGDQTLVDLAHSGNMLLPDRNPNSGTAGRMMMQLGVPLLAGGVVGGGQGAYTGDWENALTNGVKTAATVGALPKAAQWMMNSPTGSKYLTQGLRGSLSPVRNVLEAPQTNAAVGSTVRRLGDLYGLQENPLKPAVGNQSGD